MATIRDIITQSYRESGIIQKGSAPDADQMQEGLTKLLYIIDNVFGEEVGSKYVDISYGTNGVENVFGIDRDGLAVLNSTYVQPSYRLLVNIDSPQTVFLDPSPYEGSRLAVIDVSGNLSSNSLTIDGNGRKIEGGTSVVLNTDGVSAEWFYRGDLAEWVRIDTLDLNSSTPFPSKFDEYFVIKLAIRLNPRYLVQTAPETQKFYQEMKRKFRSQYAVTQEMRSEKGLYYRLASDKHFNLLHGNSSIAFTKGLLR